MLQLESRHGFIGKATRLAPTFVDGQLAFGADKSESPAATMLDDEPLNHFQDLPQRLQGRFHPIVDLLEFRRRKFPLLYRSKSPAIVDSQEEMASL